MTHTFVPVLSSQYHSEMSRGIDEKNNENRSEMFQFCAISMQTFLQLIPTNDKIERSGKYHDIMKR